MIPSSCSQLRVVCGVVLFFFFLFFCNFNKFFFSSCSCSSFTLRVMRRTCKKPGTHLINAQGAVFREENVLPLARLRGF